MSNARRIMESNADTVEVLIFALLFIGSVLDVTGISVPFAAAMAMMMYVRILSLARQVDDMYTLLDFVASKRLRDIDSHEEEEEDKEEEEDEEEEDEEEQTKEEEAKTVDNLEEPAKDATPEQVGNNTVESGVVIEEDDQKTDMPQDEEHETQQDQTKEEQQAKEETESSSPVENNVTLSVESVVNTEVTDMEFIEGTQHINLTLD